MTPYLSRVRPRGDAPGAIRPRVRSRFEPVAQQVPGSGHISLALPGSPHVPSDAAAQDVGLRDPAGLPAASFEAPSPRSGTSMADTPAPAGAGMERSGDGDGGTEPARRSRRPARAQGPPAAGAEDPGAPGAAPSGPRAGAAPGGFRAEVAPGGALAGAAPRGSHAAAPSGQPAGQESAPAPTARYEAEQLPSSMPAAHAALTRPGARGAAQTAGLDHGSQAPGTADPAATAGHGGTPAATQPPPSAPRPAPDRAVASAQRRRDRARAAEEGDDAPTRATDLGDQPPAGPAEAPPPATGPASRHAQWLAAQAPAPVVRPAEPRVIEVPTQVSVTIGRIEVRSAPAPATPGPEKPARPRREPPSLDDYLRARASGRAG